MARVSIISDFPSSHNHRRCVAEAVAAAKAHCAELDINLTPLRAQILELVWSRHGPIGAYDILERLKNNGRRAAPNTVYRALDFLLEAGLIHRLDTLNAFIGCASPDRPHAAQFLICSDCGLAAEISDPAIGEALSSRAKKLKFRIDAQTVEISGLCEKCRD